MNSPTPQDRPGMARMRRTIDPGLSGDTRAPAGAPKRKAIVRLASFAPLLAGVAIGIADGVQAQTSCPGAEEIAAGLDAPLGIARTPLGNLLVSESGAATNDGRVSIVSSGGATRRLLSGLPSGVNDVGGRSGPAGVFMRGRTLYVAIGIGDTIRQGPVPGSALPNSNPSSPIFSSVLAVHFSANVEKTTTGFALSLADQHALATGQRVTLSNGGGETVSIELVANFPDFVPRPEFPIPGIVRGSNPFDLVVDANHAYVTDGGRNLTFKVDLSTGRFSELAAFANIANPFPFGPPSVEAVPTGIAESNGSLLVALFRGAPFPPGGSVIESLDPATGTNAPFIGGLKTAIDVVAINSRPGTEHLVLQYDSFAGPFFGAPGRVLRYRSPAMAPELINYCLATPTSMAFDERGGRLYVTEEGLAPGLGRVVAISVQP